VNLWIQGLNTSKSENELQQHENGVAAATPHPIW